MELKYIPIVCIVMLLTVIIELRKVDAQRSDDFYGNSDNIERFDRDYYVSVPLTDYRLSRLRRGYYYIDDGFITSVPQNSHNPLDGRSNRRQDDSETGKRSSYQPLIKYKETKAKRKKLFVPNFFG